MVDLATLTGAIIVSLGSEYAGLFSNDDKLSKQLINAGNKVGEKLWRMPLDKNYDKLIDLQKTLICKILIMLVALAQQLQHNFCKDLFLIKLLGLI